MQNNFKQSYDYIFAGGGAAGLSLAYRMVNSPLKGRSILMIDREIKDQNDRTWCFWNNHPTPFDSIVFRGWEKLQFISDEFNKEFNLSPYQYKMIRGIDLYRFTRQALEDSMCVNIIHGNVDKIIDGSEFAEVRTGDDTYHGNWVFDSLWRPNELNPDPSRFHSIKQHFKGLEIDTNEYIFYPSTVTLFDFRTPQKGAMRFIYILPFSARRALVEYTLFSADLLAEEEYDKGLKDYIESVLRIHSYEIMSVETGSIPMTDYPFQRRGGQRVINIGTKGGRVKPSTGYAFLRIQKDSDAILSSLLKNEPPIATTEERWDTRLNDSIMLQLMYRRGDIMKSIFTDLFKNNPIQRIFQFLDERGSIWSNLPVLLSLNPTPFLQAWFKIKVLRKI